MVQQVVALDKAKSAPDVSRELLTSDKDDSEKARERQARKKAKIKDRLLKEAAKVFVDYRPVMSRIMGDYLFRCPSWHFAHKLSRIRHDRGEPNSNVYVYEFSHSTHIPGFKE